MFDKFMDVLAEREKKAQLTDEMTSMLKKLSVSEISKVAYCGDPGNGKTWLSKYEGSNLYDRAVALEEELLNIEAKRIEKRMDEPRDDLYTQEDMVRLKKRMLDLELSKLKATGEAPEELEEEEEEEEEGPEGNIDIATPEDATKAASVFVQSMAKEAQGSMSQRQADVRSMGGTLGGIGGALGGGALGGGLSLAGLVAAENAGVDLGALGVDPAMLAALGIGGGTLVGAGLGGMAGHSVGKSVGGALAAPKQASAESVKEAQGGYDPGYYGLGYGAAGAAIPMLATGVPTPDIGLASGLGAYYGAQRGAPSGRASEGAVKGAGGATAGYLGGGLLGGLGGGALGAGLGYAGASLLGPRLGIDVDPRLAALGGGLGGALLGGGVGGVLGGRKGYRMATEGLEEPKYAELTDPVQIARLVKQAMNGGREATPTMPNQPATPALPKQPAETLPTEQTKATPLSKKLGSGEKTAKVLSAVGRGRIKEKNFAIPKKGDEDKYPIHDRRHASNALTRVRQYGSPSEKAKVYAAVAKKYPGLAATSSVKAVQKKAKGKKKESAGASCKTAEAIVSEYLEKMAKEKDEKMDKKPPVNTRWRPPQLPTPDYIGDADVYAKRLANRVIHKVLKGVKSTETKAKRTARRAMGKESSAQNIASLFEQSEPKLFKAVAASSYPKA